MDITSFVLGLQRGKSMGGSGGSGGGSLPDGVYFSGGETKFPTSTYYSPLAFVLNGEKYCVCSNTTSASYWIVYKWNGTAWVTVISQLIWGDYDNGNVDWHGGIEYNGKYHIMAPERKSHYTFDGTSLVKMDDVPWEVSYYQKLFIYNGLLTYYTTDYDSTPTLKAFYQWDENSDTWTLLCNDPFSFLSDYFVYNDDLYVLAQFYASASPTGVAIRGLFKLENGEFVLVAELSSRILSGRVVTIIGDNVIIYYSNYGEFYKVNMTTYEYALICKNFLFDDSNVKFVKHLDPLPSDSLTLVVVETAASTYWESTLNVVLSE